MFFFVNLYFNFCVILFMCSISPFNATAPCETCDGAPPGWCFITGFAWSSGERTCLKRFNSIQILWLASRHWSDDNRLDHQRQGWAEILKNFSENGNAKNTRKRENQGTENFEIIIRAVCSIQSRFFSSNKYLWMTKMWPWTSSLTCCGLCKILLQ